MEGPVRMSSRTIRALFVDDEEQLRDQYIENLTIALQDACDVEVEWTISSRVEEAKKALPRGQARFQLVVVDLLWKAIGRGRAERDSRGLEVVGQAAKTAGVVIVAISVGDTTNFPELPEQAREAGAHVFRIRGALQAAARSGGWDRLAEEICEALRGVGGRDREKGSCGSMAMRAAATLLEDDVHKRVFVVSGRNDDLTSSVYSLLRSVTLHPYEWEQLVALAIESGRGGGNPNVFDIVEFGFEISHGAVILFSPDDEVRLSSGYHLGSDPTFELELAGQPRPNVLLETGYALRHDRNHTLIVSVGQLRPASDLAGMHMLNLDNSISKRKTFVERLRAMGFDLDTSGDHWLKAGDFSI
jgi:predicted nucleotide-binding protein